MPRSKSFNSGQNASPTLEIAQVVDPGGKQVRFANLVYLLSVACGIQFGKSRDTLHFKINDEYLFYLH